MEGGQNKGHKIGTFGGLHRKIAKKTSGTSDPRQLKLEHLLRAQRKEQFENCGREDFSLFDAAEGMEFSKHSQRTATQASDLASPPASLGFEAAALLQTPRDRPTVPSFRSDFISLRDEIFRSNLTPTPVSKEIQSRNSAWSEKPSTLSIFDIELSARYSLKEELGRGAFSIVRRGVRKDDFKVVAVKTFENDRKKPSVIESVIQNEVRILKKVSSPHIVKFFEVIRTQKYTHIILEALPGITLERFLMESSEGCLPESHAKQLFLQMVETASFLSSRRVFHRDLKLENVMICPQGQTLTLIDFGFAVDTSQICSQKLVCGTPYYMPPESVNSSLANYEPAEVWALGVNLYKMVSGSYPFKEQRSSDNHMFLDYEYIRPKNISESLETLFRQIFEVDPEKRLKIAQLLQHEWFSNNSTFAEC